MQATITLYSSAWANSSLRISSSFSSYFSFPSFFHVLRESSRWALGLPWLPRLYCVLFFLMIMPIVSVYDRNLNKKINTKNIPFSIELYKLYSGSGHYKKERVTLNTSCTYSIIHKFDTHIEVWTKCICSYVISNINKRLHISEVH